MLTIQNAVAPKQVRLAPTVTWTPATTRPVALASPSWRSPKRESGLGQQPFVPTTPTTPAAPAASAAAKNDVPFIDGPFFSFLMDLAGTVTFGILGYSYLPRKYRVYVPDPATGKPMVDPKTGTPITQEVTAGRPNMALAFLVLAGAFGIKGIVDLSRIK